MKKLKSPPITTQPSLDHLQRMFEEAKARIHDAGLLASSPNTASDSAAILRILGFEILLKCAVLLCGQTPKKNHDYDCIWKTLPGKVRKDIQAAAATQMAGYADFSDLGKLLKTYQYVFEKARYHYELYENYTLDEQHELEVLWLQIGAPPKEAVVQYHPYELLGLIAGLSSFIEACLRKLACAAN